MTVSQTKVANDTHFDKTFTVEISGQVATAVAIKAPETLGKSIAVKGVLMTSDNTAGDVRLYFATDEDGDANTVAQLYADDQVGYFPCLLKGDPDESLYVDSTIDGNVFILVNYREE